MELTPSISTVALGEKVNLKAIKYIFPDTEDGLVPLGYPETGMGEPDKLDSKYIVKWTLSGPGSLTSNGNEAVYTAPTTKPANKTATVTVEINVNGKQVLLIGTIYIIEGALQLSFDDGPWTTYPAMAAKMEENKYSIGNIMLSTDQPQISVLFSSSAAKVNNTFFWDMLTGGDEATVFEYFEPGREHVYASVYQKAEHETIDSPGILTVKEETIDGKKFLTGMFVIARAGYFEISIDGDQLKTSKIVGAFKVPLSTVNIP
ncbi:hypothetical protein D3C80_257730 [compost metagenome]